MRVAAILLHLVVIFVIFPIIHNVLAILYTTFGSEFNRLALGGYWFNSINELEGVMNTAIGITIVVLVPTTSIVVGFISAALFFKVDGRIYAMLFCAIFYTIVLASFNFVKYGIVTMILSCCGVMMASLVVAKVRTNRHIQSDT